MGAPIDRSVNDGGGLNIFKICGQVCHRMGSLLPEDGKPPKFAELYVFHAGNEADNRIRALHKDDKTEGGLDKSIINALTNMLDVHNSLVKKFRMAKDILAENEIGRAHV